MPLLNLVYGIVYLILVINKLFSLIDLKLQINICYNFCFRNSSLPIEILDYQNDGAFDVTISTLFSESELPSRTTFFCELIIPSTPYNITKRFVYNPGKIYINIL